MLRFRREGLPRGAALGASLAAALMLGPTVPAGHSHDLVALERHQALVVVMVDGRQVLDQARGWGREPGEEAAVHSLGGEAFEEAPQPFAVAGPDRADDQPGE